MEKRMGEAELSVILPVSDFGVCYGVLWNLFNQTFSNFELVVIGREEERKEIDRLCAFWQTLNGILPKKILANWDFSCLARNRNEGVRISEGELSFFLNDAVLLQSCVLETLQNDIQLFKVDFVNCGLWYLEEIGGQLRFYGGRDENGWVISWSSPGLIKREVFREIGGYDVGFVGWGGEDDELTYRLAKGGYKRAIDLRIGALHIPHKGMERGGKSKDKYVMDKHGLSFGEMYSFYSSSDVVRIIE